MASFKPPIWRLAFPGKVAALQLWHHNDASAFIEFASGPRRIREKSRLEGRSDSPCRQTHAPSGCLPAPVKVVIEVFGKVGGQAFPIGIRHVSGDTLKGRREIGRVVGSGKRAKSRHSELAAAGEESLLGFCFESGGILRFAQNDD
jgi:hypothetical protein